MRGFFAFALLALFVPSYLALLSLDRDIQSSRERAVTDALAIRSVRSFAQGTRDSLKSALGSLPAGELSSAEGARLAGERINEWAALIEGRAAQDGLMARAWCGAPTEEALRSLSESMMLSRDARLCEGCVSPGELTLDFDGEPIRTCASLLAPTAQDGAWEVSGAGLLLVPKAGLWVPQGLSRGVMGLGVSIYSPRSNTSLVVSFPEGFGDDDG